MIDVRVRLALPFVRIGIKMARHIFVYFSLQVYPYCAVASNNFIGAYSGVGRHIAAWVWDPNVIRHICHVVMSPFDSGIDKPSNKILMQPALRPSCRG